MRHDVYNLKDKRESEPWCIMYAFNAVKKKKKKSRQSCWKASER